MKPRPLLGPNRGVSPSVNDREWLMKVRQLNDDFRTSGRGGMVLISEGLARHSVETVNLALAKISCFAAFTCENDPWGEHDSGSVGVDGLPVTWRIDHFDRSRTMHSRNPAYAAVTTRVLSLLLEGEEMWPITASSNLAPLVSLVERLAAVATPEDLFKAASHEDGTAIIEGMVYDDLHDYVADLRDEELMVAHSDFMAFVREARDLLAANTCGAFTNHELAPPKDPGVA